MIEEDGVERGGGAGLARSEDEEEEEREDGSYVSSWIREEEEVQ